jgi:nitrogen fixation protein FixH
MDSSRWIPWAIAGSLGVVVAVNGALAYLATTSSPGLVDEHPFDTGNDYNRVLDAAAAQDRLGWHSAVQFIEAGEAQGELVVDLTDRTGRPLSGLVVTARLVRPLGKVHATALALAETTPGRYSAAATLAQRGQWDVRASARHASDVYDFAQRIIVK